MFLRVSFEEEDEFLAETKIHCFAFSKKRRRISYAIPVFLFGSTVWFEENNNQLESICFRSPRLGFREDELQ